MAPARLLKPSASGGEWRRVRSMGKRPPGERRVRILLRIAVSVGEEKVGGLEV